MCALVEVFFESAEGLHRFITEKDFAAMAEMGINTVRLPVSKSFAANRLGLSQSPR